MVVRPLCRSRGLLDAKACMGHTTKRIQVVDRSPAVRFVLLYLSSRPHRLAARTWPSQGQNTGSIPVGAIFLETQSSPSSSNIQHRINKLARKNVRQSPLRCRIVRELLATNWREAKNEKWREKLKQPE